ncbi:cytochrome c oxidase assembly factor CtaG [Fictibacillus phosphorivorans]|jgi:putative membrane protein|uniref:cytochrome c oxidase assembly factor CtaG n=1 Tax=Fictibacillus TaxID=1329200 RepID=UPI0018CCD733|nr:cytochrome c oxidase assembly factor CtaG [Fictibacillus sp. 23RED33]MBH0173509.1 cytochrome c oxidase assembly factor CtaG [Fictibacillus sp. 23RED33]
MWELIRSNIELRNLWDLQLLFFFLMIYVLYLIATGPYKKDFTGSTKVHPVKKIVFFIGLLLAYLGFGGPLYFLGHIFFSVHMTQMAICFIIAPPLIIYGMPRWLFQAIPNVIRSNRVVRLCKDPLFSLIAFNALFSIYHLPQVFDFMMVNYHLHHLYNIVLFLTSLMTWYIMLQSNRLSNLQKTGYIFGSGLLLTPACALIIFSSHPLYATYSNPEFWAKVMGLCVMPGTHMPENFYDMIMPLSLVEDQHLGGVLMKIIQEVVYGVALGYVFFQWMKKERQDEIDGVYPSVHNN